MYSVTKRIGMVKQPRGGYIGKKELSVTQLEDDIVLNENENISASLVGMTVDYLTRFLMDTSKETAFAISLAGARILGPSEHDNAVRLLEGINGSDDDSIINACKLVGYDVCLRTGIIGYKPVEEINPNSETIENIQTMINRSLCFWSDYGPIIKDGFTFEGGYTSVISTGDGDYLTKDTLWDFKVSKDEPKPKYTLQLLVYYIMGLHSIHKEFKDIENLGIYNPRLNKIYTIDVSSIPAEIIDEVSMDVIGYK